MKNYDKLISYLPVFYRKKNNLALLKGFALCFDKFDNDLNSLDKIWVVTKASGEYLDIIGNNIHVYRANGQNDLIYRTKIQMKLYNTYFVPILDNLIEFVEKITGYYAENIKEGWLDSEQSFESGRMKMDLVVPYNYTKELITDLETVYSAGVRLDVKSYVETFTTLEGFGNFNLMGIEDFPILTNRVLYPADEFLQTPLEGFGNFNLMGIEDLPINF